MERNGVTGVDAAYSRMLVNGNRLWIFGDTLVGHADSGRRFSTAMFHNAVAVEMSEEGKFTYYWGAAAADTRQMQGVFTNPRKGEFYWPADMLEINSTLYVFLRRVTVVENAGNPAFGFRLTGNDIAIIPNPYDVPQDWHIEIGSLNDSPRTLGVAAALHDGYLYLLENDPAQHHALYLARISLEQVRKQDFTPDYYHEGSHAWRGQPPAKPFVAVGAPEASLRYDAGRGQWRLVYTEGGLGEKVVMRTAENIEGPWSDAISLYYAPEREGILYYAAKEIDGTQQKNGFALAVCNNAADPERLDEDSGLYVPNVIFLEERAYPLCPSPLQACN